jgi:hypothetical protein
LFWTCSTWFDLLRMILNILAGKIQDLLVLNIIYFCDLFDYKKRRKKTLFYCFGYDLLAWSPPTDPE